ncbi:hypothetical protein XENOCAPTIV_025035, partial [Xenoophorus captivus]
NTADSDKAISVFLFRDYFVSTPHSFCVSLGFCRKTCLCFFAAVRFSASARPAGSVSSVLLAITPVVFRVGLSGLEWITAVLHFMGNSPLFPVDAASESVSSPSWSPCALVHHYSTPRVSSNHSNLNV